MEDMGVEKLIKGLKLEEGKKFYNSDKLNVI